MHQNNKKYCPDVWHGMFLEKQTSRTAKISFCCQSGVSDEMSEVDFLTTPFLVKNRDKFFDDPQNAKLCASCWRAEDLGNRSRRHAIIEWYEHRKIPMTTDVVMNSLDYNTENACNLQCLTCSSKYSSAWIPLEKSLGITSAQTPKTHTKHNKLLDGIELSNLRRVYFNGGEPFLTADHKNVLKKIVDQQGSLSEVDINYSTSGVALPDQETFELWSSANSVRLMLSIDAVGEAFEFIRYPANWQQVQDNILKIFAAKPDVFMDITFTLGLHNIFYLDDTLAWFEKNLGTNPVGDTGLFSLQLAGPFTQGGRLLSLGNLPQPAKTHALNTLTKAREYPFWASIESVLRTDASDTSFIKYLEDISNFRRTHWGTALNRLKTALESAGV